MIETSFMDNSLYYGSKYCSEGEKFLDLETGQRSSCIRGRSPNKKNEIYFYTRSTQNNYCSISARFLQSKQAVEVQTSKDSHRAVMNPMNLAELQDRSKKGEKRNSRRRMNRGGSPSISGYSQVDAAA